MTVASEITRLQTAKADIKTAIQGKWVSVPASAKLDTYDTYINQIDTGAAIKWLLTPVVATKTAYAFWHTWSPNPSEWASRGTYVTYEDSTYWMYLYFFEPWVYSSDCAWWDHATAIDSIIWVCNKSNNYSVSKNTWGYKYLGTWRAADRNAWDSDWFWGTRYLYKKWTQFKLQIYNSDISRNYTYDYSIVAYWLYDLTFDISTNTVSTSQIYSQKNVSSYSNRPRQLPTEWEYENLEQYPDSTWELLGNPSGNNMNQWYAWYSVAPTFNGSRLWNCAWDGTVSLLFTA